MPPSQQPRVFISYARKDGAALAQRLQTDLKEEGFDAWLDTQRMAGGAVWTNEIETALDQAEYVVALLTQGSYVSEICRAEQLRALRKHKCVIPLMAQLNSDVPLHLEAKNYRDFTAASRYTQAFTELLGDLQSRNGVALKPEFRETRYVTVPPLPVNFVERPEALAALRNVLITDDGGRHIALTALEGMGGIGKTVLAQALCHDEVVQQAFPDGIVWITIGKESAFNAVTRMREVGKALGDDLSRYDNELAAKNQYRSTVRKKAALIVVDDVWRSTDLEPLRAEDSPRSRLLFTTRDASIAAAMGAREHVADLLTEEQSREVLARWSRNEIANLPPITAQLIHECGRLPLALSMVGAMLRGKPAAYWKAVLEHLRNADLDKIKAQFPDYPYTDVLRAIQVSVDSLDETSRARYLALAVLLEEMAAAPAVQQCLWGVDENQAAETAEQFVSLSLAQGDQPEGSIRLHDLQLDYVRGLYPKEDKEALELIRGAIRLSSHVIGKDPQQFASQVVGRLLPYQEIPAIEEFTHRVSDSMQKPWLRPLRPALHRPGTALLRTLTGHTTIVNAVAMTPDGKRAVSASWDKTLKVWDLENGHELRTLRGHTEWVRGVVMSTDGQRAVSGSDDKTLKVWDLDSGIELRTLAGHLSSVSGVALTADGKRAVSASADATLKVWDLESGRELRALTGHANSVNAAAVTPDGRLAVSASADRTLKVWDLESGLELRTLQGHSAAVTGVAVSASGQRAISASEDKTLRVWDLESGFALRIMKGHSAALNGVAVSANWGRAASASKDSTLKVWDVDSGRELHTLDGHSWGIFGLAMSADGRLAVSASGDSTLKVWNVDSGHQLHGPQGHSSLILGVAMSADARRAISACGDHTLKVWDVDSGRELHTLIGHSDAVYSVAASADGRLAVSGSGDRTLKLWDVDAGRELRTLTGHSDAIYCVAMSGDGRLAVSASVDHTLKVWELDSGRELHTLAGHSESVLGVAMSADGRRAVSASSDKTLKVWDLESGHELSTLKCECDLIRCVAVSADWRRAVSAPDYYLPSSDEFTLTVWDLESERELRTFVSHSDCVYSLSVSADGRRIVSASDDKTVKIWDLNAEEVLATFTCDGATRCCTFSDALQLIVAGDAGGHLHFLRLEEPKPKP